MKFQIAVQFRIPAIFFLPICGSGASALQILIIDSSIFHFQCQTLLLTFKSFFKWVPILKIIDLVEIGTCKFIQIRDFF